ncbi:MAG: redoxin domain-containing protein [Phycisphaerae bacterium]
MASSRPPYLLLAALPALALAVPATAAVSVGQRAPEISATDWLNAPRLSLAKLRGKIAVVEFWATWCPPCRATIPHLAELHKTYRDKGVVIIGLTDEPKSKVEPFAGQMAMTYAVGCGSQSKDVYGVRGIPHAFVVDVAGKVVWRGHPGGSGLEGAIEEQLRTNPPTLLSPKEKTQALALLKKVEDTVGEERYVRAAAMLDRIRDPEKDPDVKKRVAAVRKRLAARAEARAAEAEAHIKKKEYYEADVALGEVAVLARDSDLAETARARRAELQKDKVIRAAIEQGRRERAASEPLADLEKKTPEMSPAARLKAYEALAEAHPGTEAGAAAAAKAEAMRSDEALMARIADRMAEKHCKGWLSMARNFLKAGMPAKAEPYLKKVMEKYPETDFARQAKEMRAKIEK